VTHFLATVTQLLARIRRESSFRGANFGVFSIQLFQADLRVNCEFGQEYASEKSGISVLIKLNELAIKCVRSGEFMVFPTQSLGRELDRRKMRGGSSRSTAPQRLKATVREQVYYKQLRESPGPPGLSIAGTRPGPG
jgi:hypothetical protein